MEQKIWSQINLLNYQKNSRFENSDNEASQFNQGLTNQLLNFYQLKSQRLAILSRTYNDFEMEQLFRRICTLYENECPHPDLSLSQAYQDYIKAYHQITSLYLIQEVNERIRLVIYDTEFEKEDMKTLETPKKIDIGTCITQIPNAELFCFGCDHPTSGTTLIIDSNYGVRVLPSGAPCSGSSAIYFNRSVYCFGGSYRGNALSLSNRFDLDKFQWIKLTPMPKNDFLCNSAMYNGNILISGCFNKNILQYSVDIDSFSTIPYEFGVARRKVLIRVEERFYLFECAGSEGLIYESDIGSEYLWKQIAGSIIFNDPFQAYCSYNKGAIHIKISSQNRYYKFDLRKKFMIRIQKDELQLKFNTNKAISL